MDLPEPISPTRVAEILQQGITTQQLRDEVVSGHLRLAASIAGAFASKFSRLHDDLYGVAFLETTTAVDRIANGKKVNDANHLSNYVAATVNKRCKDFISENVRTMHMVARTIRYKLRTGLNTEKNIAGKVIADRQITPEAKEVLLKLPVVYQEAFLEQAKELPIANFREVIQSALYSLLPIPKVQTIEVQQFEGDDFIIKTGFESPEPKAKPTLSLDFVELIRKSILSPMEEAVINYRSQGYTYHEIAPKVGLSHVTVGNYVNKVAERFDELNKKG
jgi:hypothetical protein